MNYQNHSLAPSPATDPPTNPSAPAPTAPRPPNRLLTWRSGGWALAVSGVLVLAVAGVFVWHLARGGSRATGDGRTVESYGFALEPLLVPRGTLVAAGVTRDEIPALVDPPVITPAQADALDTGRRRYLVSDDRVIGVVQDGAARAYPLRVLDWHEVVNDTLGGVPLLVAYHPLGEAVAVADRRVAGRVRVFGHSGLLSNSLPLLYDRQERAADESLWLAPAARAVAGPAAARGERLRLVPAALVPWAAWRAAHPETTVLDPSQTLGDRFRQKWSPYSAYRGSDELRFPVAPLPDRVATFPYKTPVIIISAGGSERALPFPELAARAPEGRLALALAGAPITVRYDAATNCAWVEAPGAGAADADEGPGAAGGALGSTGGSTGYAVRYAAWFAWHALVGGAGERAPVPATRSVSGGE